MKKLPNFIIVGAAKCGTSSLHNYLNQHPDVFMPTFTASGKKVKEPKFFITSEIQRRVKYGIWDWNSYKNLFEGVTSEKAIGEASVFYLFYYKTAIKNIKKYLGDDIKIIIMLRNPTERAISAFTHVARGKQESLSFEDALKNEKNRLSKDLNITPMIMYKEMGLYYKMVKSYLDNFDNVHIILYEDFKQKTDLVVKETLKFLNLSSDYIIDTSLKYNVGGKKWKNKYVKLFFMQDNILKKILRFIFSKKIRFKFRFFIELIFKEPADEVNQVTRKKLDHYFQNDILKLEELLNLDLKHWMK